MKTLKELGFKPAPPFRGHVQSSFLEIGAAEAVGKMLHRMTGDRVRIVSGKYVYYLQRFTGSRWVKA